MSTGRRKKEKKLHIVILNSFIYRRVEDPPLISSNANGWTLTFKDVCVIPTALVPKRLIQKLWPAEQKQDGPQRRIPHSKKQTGEVRR